MNWYLSAFKKYAVFTGRARRKEYWFFQLFNTLFVVALIVLDAMTGMMRARTDVRFGIHLGVLSGLYVLATFLPSLGVLVRRLHDTDRSGWWVLIGLVPFVGPIALFVFTVLEGTPGLNRYQP